MPALAAAFGERIHSLAVGRPTLEDAFVHFTGHRMDTIESSETGEESLQVTEVKTG
ncbi:MAG: hypothetical protein HY719_12025 [Planctomycetes bacterium]|nr:hypothetical protein [Planctomycetota bacterium]